MNKLAGNFSHEYDGMLHQGIKLSGEEKQYFISGRLQDLRRHLPAGFVPRRILDYGCGIGDTTKILAEMYPQAKVDGFDTDDRAITHAKKIYDLPKLTFYNTYDFLIDRKYDLCYSNGVFHHILPDQRPAVVKQIRQALIPGGFFALFENNPWNPGTRLVMARIPFDREARVVSPPQAYRLLRQGGFAIQNFCRFLFYFPRPLWFLRRFEHFLSRVPLGAQYYILALKPA
jgi:SAM-dependent methyltransferase